MENCVLNLLTLDINTKHFINFQLQNYLYIFAILTYLNKFKLKMLIKKIV